MFRAGCRVYQHIPKKVPGFHPLCSKGFELRAGALYPANSVSAWQALELFLKYSRWAVGAFQAVQAALGSCVLPDAVRVAGLDAGEFFAEC